MYEQHTEQDTIKPERGESEIIINDACAAASSLAKQTQHVHRARRVWWRTWVV